MKVDLDMSIAAWFACMDCYKLAVSIVGCTSVTPVILSNHVMTMGKVIEQVSRNGGTYNKIVLVSFIFLRVCVLACVPFPCRHTMTVGVGDGPNLRGWDILTLTS